MLGLAALAGVEAAFAQGTPDQVLFGPKQYLRITGAPNVYADAFSVPAAIGAPFVLRIVNGSANGANRVNFALVKVNGVQVAGPGDFGPKSVEIERTVTLGQINNLEVSLAGGPKGLLTLTLLGTRTLPTVVSLTPVTASVTPGASTSLTLAISSAQATDTVVPLATAPAGIVSVPAEVIVPAGQSTVSVPVTALALGQAGITAGLNGTSASSLINVVPPPVAVTALEPPTHIMTAGATSTFAVRINAAQLADTEIALAVDNPAVLSVPASVTVAQGATSAVFTATAFALGDAVIAATVNNTQATAAVHVAPQPAAIVSLLPNPLPLQQGSEGSLTVTISVAQETDTIIALANSDPAVVQAPATVTVAAGATIATFPVNALAPGVADVTASVNGTGATSRVEVTPLPPVVSEITPATLTLSKGAAGVLRVVVSRAPNVPTAVALVSSNPAAAQVPATVNIAAGALFAEFPVAALAEGQATITTSLNGGAASATVTITAAELVSLTLSPDPASANTGEAVSFTATGTMTDGTSQDFSARVTWSSSNTAVATISAAGLASALAGGQTTIGASFTFTAAQTGQAVTIAASTTLTVNAVPTVSITTPANNSIFAAPATITLTAIAQDLDGAIAQVEFFQGATLLATVTNAPYTFTLNDVASGTYSFMARATDNRGAATSSAVVMVTVNALPTVSITSPAKDATFTAPASIIITANASDPDGTINRVDFYSNGNLIGESMVSPYSVTLVDAAAGTHSLTARATDNLGGVASSDPVTVTVNPGVAQIYFIHTDHLNTPRLIANQSQQAVWRWDNTDPFGNNAPNENPSGLGNFTCNLRLPGQYFDKETNNHYNWWRTYFPDLGRYGQSDPVGLQGGINTYLYARANPLSNFDPDGLKAVFCCRLLDSFVFGSALRQRHCYFNVDGTTYGLYPEGNVGIPRINDPRDRGGTCKDCSPLPCSDVKFCIKDQHDFYPIGNYSATAGPNSNTYAGTIARACCQGGIPSGVGSAPSIGDDPPTHNPLGSRGGSR